MPRATRAIGAFIETELGGIYESRSGLIALLHRLGLEHHKPNVLPRKLDEAKLDEAKQKSFIALYEKPLNSLAAGEAVLLIDAVHPTHAARPAGCFAPRGEKLAIEQTSGRPRISIHGAIDLETGQPSAIAYHDRSAQMIEALTADALSTLTPLESIEAPYPMLVLIHVFLDNARYRHPPDHGPGVARDWLAQPGRRAVPRMSEAHQMPLMRGELPNAHPAMLPAREPGE